MRAEKINAYELIQQENLSDLKSEGYLLRHKKSGAKVVLLENEDENKVFYVGFRTPVDDSTGVPHILEHSVLCGSKNFQVKDPFVELVKGSLNTFLNAMTYPDKTMYPVASCNDKDFQNLMHVYMDAVFYPNIYHHPEIFRQEGWSYKLDSADSKLEYNGVVYNEMKGAFSSPEGVLDRMILNSLFPDTNYANESGGDPDVIPELTYEQFLDFHKRYYHPTNSYIYLYGKMDMEEKLNWLDEHYLSEFEEEPVDSCIREQKPFTHMAELTKYYSISSNESEEDNTYLSYNKVIGTSLDEKLSLAFEILDYALLSAPGAPLKKALLDAGIGKDIMGSYDNGIYQPVFSVIAKNANADEKERFVETIECTLRDLVKNGINQKALEAGLNYHEFRYREADYGNYPKGLMYGLQIMDSWLYDETKPFMHIQAIPTFEFLKEQVGTGYFESLIQTWILDNPHGSYVTVCPEKGRTGRMDKELEERLQAYKESLTPEEIERLADDTKALAEYQETEDTPEDMEKIPLLRREDITTEITDFINEERTVTVNVSSCETVPMVYHPVETNGIAYLSVMFDLSNVSEELLPYVGILQSVLGIIDTTNYEYGELFNEINLHTGGIGTSLELYNNVQNIKEKEFKATFEVKGKALYPKLNVLFDMMKEILTESKLKDEKRLKEILSMAKSRLQMRFQSAGHTTSALRALSYSSPSCKFKDDTDGIGYYQVVKHLEEHFDEEKSQLIATLKKLCTQIFRADQMMISCTGTKECLEPVSDGVKKLAESLDASKKAEETACVLHCEKKNEGFQTSSKVQYVAQAGNFIDKGVPYHGALQILKVILSYDYLWMNIRVKGGAYGCMSSFNRVGEGYFVSYRDPNLERTVEVYKGVVEYLKNFTVNERDMTKYIIGTISNIDRPLTPAAAGDRAMNLYMNHVTREMLETERKQILTAQQEDIRSTAAVVQAVLEAGQICVIGNEEKIEKQKAIFKEVKELF